MGLFEYKTRDSEREVRSHEYFKDAPVAVGDIIEVECCDGKFLMIIGSPNVLELALS